MANGNTFWTPERDATLAAMIAQGKSHRECAEHFGRSVAGVRVRACMIGARAKREAVRAHQSRSIREVNKQPEVKARRAAAMARRWETEDRAKYAHYVARLHTPEMRQRHAEAIRKRNAAKLAWCPDHMRDQYERYRKGYGAAIARQKIERAMREAEQARLAGMSRFERQLELARNGAKIIEISRPVANDTAMGRSLIGSSMA